MSLIEAKFQCLGCARSFLRTAAIELHGSISAATRTVLANPRCLRCGDEEHVRLIACRHEKTPKETAHV